VRVLKHKDPSEVSWCSNNLATNYSGAQNRCLIVICAIPSVPLQIGPNDLVSTN
jgi:hypothetical protein